MDKRTSLRPWKNRNTDCHKPLKLGMGVSAAPITWMSLGEINPQQGAGDVWLREGQVNTRQQMQLVATNRALSKSVPSSKFGFGHPCWVLRKHGSAQYTTGLLEFLAPMFSLGASCSRFSSHLPSSSVPYAPVVLCFNPLSIHFQC